MVKALKLSVLAVSMTVLASCGATFRNHGYIPPAEDLQNVVVGVDTRDTVASAVGRPCGSVILTDCGWFYVRSRYRNFAWRAPEEIDREVLAISFDSAGVVANVETFGLERGQVVRLSRRVTTSNTEGVGFLRQAFGNLGRIATGDLFSE